MGRIEFTEASAPHPVPHRVVLARIHGSDADAALFLDGRLLVADDNDGRNDVYPVTLISEALASALGARLERVNVPKRVLTEDWNYDDIAQWLQTR